MDVLSTDAFGTNRRLSESSIENLSNSYSSINSGNIEDILHGSAILSGGGGGSYESALELYRSLDPDSVEVRDLDDFSDDSNLATVFGLGPVDHGTDNPLEVARRSVDLYESVYEEIDGLILGELGPDLVVEAAIIADELDIPVANADVAGMRAVPSIQNEIIEDSEISRPPVVATNGEEHRYIETGTGEELEQEIRDIVDGEIWYVTGYTENPENYSEAALEGWFEETLTFEDAEIEQIGEGEVQSIEAHEVDGHTSGRMTIEGRSTIEVFFQNENLLAFRDGEQVASAPETITVIDENGQPIYNGDLPDEGQQLEVYTITYDFWQDSEAMDIQQLNLEVFGSTVRFQDQLELDIGGEVQ